MLTMELSGKTCVITGGASGIGLATAFAFGAKGARVVIGDINAEAVEAALVALKGQDIEALGQLCDVRDEDSVASLMSLAVAGFGSLDVCVSSAGILRDALLVKVDRETGKVASKLSLAQFSDVQTVNTVGAFLTGREAAATMVDLGNGGVIILLSSIARVGNFGQTAYAASKAAVMAMTVTWSRELARYGIRVGAIAPGFIETPMVMKDMQPQALERFKATIPVGRLGRPEEIAAAAVFIAENDLVTGTCVDVTGGIRL